MGKGGSSGAVGVGITTASLARVGIESDLTPAELRRTWKATFGKDLQSAGEIRDLIGINTSDLGTRGSVRVTGNEFTKELSVSASGPGLQMTRRYTPGVAHHDTLFLSDTGTGAGSRIYRTSIAKYQKLGVKEVRLQAAEIGRYVWPSKGFRVSAASMAKYRAGFRAFLEKEGIQAKGRIYSVQQIARTTHKGRKIGKEYLLSASAPNLQYMRARVSRLAKEL